MKAHRITIIIPCFNEEETLPVYYQAMLPVMKQMNPVDFELLFIDDGSSDHTLLEMKQLHQKDPRCKYLSFSRNFGKEAAIYAGLSKASGDYVAVMDVDLQDPPSLLPEMYKILIEEEYDSVATRRSDRTGEPQIRSFLSDSFYKIINRISKTEIMRGARDFRLMKRNMVDAVLEMSEYNRFSKGIFEWVGFRTKWLEYENIERSAGETKWSLKKLFVYSMEGITGFSAITGICTWTFILSDFICHDRGDYHKDIDLGRSCVWLAFAYLYHIYGKRSAAFVYGNCWAISVQNIPGDKASADLYFKRFQ